MSKTNKVLVVIIALLVIALVIGSFFTTKKVSEASQLIDSLKIENTSLLRHIAKKDSVINILSIDTVILYSKLDSLNDEYLMKEYQVRKLRKERDEVLAKWESVTSDSVYQFLQQVAYKFPGDMKYLFNEFQIKHINRDYQVARNAEVIIPAMNKQIETGKYEIEQFTALTNNLQKTINLQSGNIDDYKKIIVNDSTLIESQRHVIVKEVRRKNFWKITTGVTVLVATILLI